MSWVQSLLSKKGYNPDQPRIPSGGPGGGQWTSGRGTDAGASSFTPAQTKAREIERNIRYQDTEVVFGIDPDGNVLVSTVGTKWNAELPDTDSQFLRDNPGSVLTHNHPAGGGGLSVSDLLAAKSMRLSEVRAIHGPSGKAYSMRTTEPFKLGYQQWPPWGELEDSYNKINSSVAHEFGQAVKSGKTTVRAANAEHGVEVCRRWAKQWGKIFTEERP